MNIYYVKKQFILIAFGLLILALPTRAQMTLNMGCSWQSSNSFVLNGSVGTRNTYTGTTFGSRPIRIAWVNANNRWESQIDTDNNGSYETLTSFNATASLPNPPASATFSWTIVPAGNSCDASFSLTGAFTQNVIDFGINLQGNTTNIINGSTTTLANNGTAFGNSDGIIPIIRTFTIQNLGVSTHTLTGTAPNYVALTGSSAFTVITQPSTNTINVGSSVTFQVRFLPTDGNGTKDATVSIANSDANVNPYTFAIRGVKQVTDTKRGNAISFNGTSQYMSTTSLPTNATTNITMEGWFNFADISGTRCIMYNGNNFGNGYGLYLSSNQIHVLFGGITIPTTGVTPATNTWTHLTLVRDATTWRVYQNGVQIFTSTTNPIVPSVNFRVGANNGGTAEFMHGQIDEVRIWNVARTQTQIRENMHLTSTPNVADLIGYYQFNETSGNAIDVIGGNHGTLQGSPSRVASTVSVGGGVGKVVNVTSVGAGSEIDLTTTGLEVDFSGTSANPNAEIAVYQITAEKPLNSTIPTNVATESYWIVRSFGANTGLAFDNIKTKLLATDNFNTTEPANLKLYHRAINSGAIFTEVADANTANNTTKEINYDLPTNTILGEFFLGSVSRPVETLRGNMVNLDGVDDYLSYNAPLTTLTGSFTFEAWIYSPNDTYTTLFANGNGNGFYFIVEDGVYKIYVPGAGGGVYNTGVAPLVGEWSHLAIVHTGSAWRLYRNGVQVYVQGAVVTNTPTTSFYINNLFLYGLATHRAFKIEEFRVWESVRTATEIRDNMHLTLTGSEAGLKAYYQFNEVSGNAMDKIGGRDLTLHNGTNQIASTVSVAKGVSFTSFVNGTGVYNFTGTGCSLNFAGTIPSGEVSVYRLEGTPSSPALSGNSAYSRYYWVINNYGTNAGLSVTPTFTLGANVVNLEDVNNPTNMILNKRPTNSNGAWTQITGTSADRPTGNVTFSSISSFSEFGISSNSITPLPITLLGLKGRRVEGTEEVKLEWTTSAEINNKGFEIQVSDNAQTYKTISFVESKGNHTTIQSYNHTTIQPYDSYYRLRQVDFDGSFSYSPVVFVEGVAGKVLVYPNPNNGTFTVLVGKSPLTPEGGKVRLFNGQGIEMPLTLSFLGQGVTISPSGLGAFPAGVYFLHTVVAGKVKVTKVIIER